MLLLPLGERGGSGEGNETVQSNLQVFSFVLFFIVPLHTKKAFLLTGTHSPGLFLFLSKTAAVNFVPHFFFFFFFFGHKKNKIKIQRW